MRGTNRVLLGALVLLLAAGFTASVSSDRHPTPAPKPEAEAQEYNQYGIKVLQAKQTEPGPTVPPPEIRPLGGPDGSGALRGGIAGITGSLSLQVAGSGGAGGQAVAVEKSLRRLARDLR